MSGWGTVAFWRRTSSKWVSGILTCAFVVPIMQLSSASGVFVVQGNAMGRIAAGSEHTCAITSTSAIMCWGSTAMSQFPTPAGSEFEESLTPAPVAALGGGRVPVQITAGDFHSCVLADDGTVWCWGYGGSGAIGGVFASSSTPQQVTLEASAREVAAGGQTSCAVLVNDTAWCWGKNNFNQLGAGPSTDNSATPVKVGFVGSPAPTHVAVGSTHACAVMSDGTVWCWGNYRTGRLGTTVASNATTPAAVTLPAGASVVAAGAAHTCAVLTGGRLTCFGNNADGQLGVDTSPATYTSTPSDAMASGAARVSAGETHTCVLGTSSTVTCTGAGYTNLQQMTNLQGDEVDVVSGAQHTCAVAANGGVRCWGTNTKGQLGIGNRTTTATPTLIGSFSIASTTTTTLSSSSSGSTPSSSTPTSTLATTSTIPTTTVAPSSTATTPNVAKPTSLRLRVGRTVSAIRVVRSVGFTVPKKSQGTLRVSIVKGARNCAFVGTRIKGVRPGSCRVRVMRIPRRGAIKTRYITIRVVR